MIQTMPRFNSYFPTPALQSTPQLTRFGWKAAELEADPERYQITLKLGKAERDELADVYWNGRTLEPTKALIEKVYSRLTRTNLNVPGIAEITNIADFLKTTRKVSEFKRKLFIAVDDLYRERNLSQFKEEVFEKREFRQIDGKHRQPSGFMSAAKFTLKRFHHDSHTIIACHSYDKIRGIKGGSFLVFDDKQFAKDNGLRAQDLYELEADQVNFPCSPVLKTEYKDKIQDYVLKIDTIPKKMANGRHNPKIIFFNNLSIAHGATQFEKIKKHWERSYDRIFSRLSDLGETIRFPSLPFHEPAHHQHSRVTAHT